MQHIFKNFSRSLFAHRGVKAVAAGVSLFVLAGCGASSWRYPVGHRYQSSHQVERQRLGKSLFQQKREIRRTLIEEYGLRPVLGNSNRYRYPDGSIVTCKDRVGVAGLYSECDGPDGRFTAGGRFGGPVNTYER